MLIFAAVSFAACDGIDNPDESDKDKTENNEGTGGNEEGNGNNGSGNEGNNGNGNNNGNGGNENEGGNEGGENGGNENEGGNEGGNENTDLQPSEQKEKIAEVGQDLLDMAPASEWEDYVELVDDFANSFYMSEDYDWGSIFDWVDEEADEVYKENCKLTKNGNTYTEEWTYELILLMANHTGLFTCTEDGVTFSEYNGTKAVFYLNGNTYAAEIKSSGKVTEAKYVWQETYEWMDNYYYDPEKGEHVDAGKEIERVAIDKYAITIGVPEQIDIDLTENGSSLAKITLKFTTSFTKNQVNITTDSFSVNATASINGVEFVADKVAYNASTGKASYSASIKKNGKALISSSMSADVKIKESVKTWESSYDKGSYTVIEVEKLQSIAMDMDILGQIQVKGTCTNAMEAYEELDAVYYELNDYDWETGNSKNPNENEARRHLNNFNAKLSLNIYYDGGNTKQASVEFDIAKYVDNYDGWVSYDIIPILVFNDGSKYKIEEFFTENAFGDLVDNFYELCESFEDLLGYSE